MPRPNGTPSVFFFRKVADPYVEMDTLGLCVAVLLHRRGALLHAIHNRAFDDGLIGEQLRSVPSAVVGAEFFLSFFWRGVGVNRPCVECETTLV